MRGIWRRICALVLVATIILAGMPLSAVALSEQKQEDFYRVNTWWQDAYNQQYIEWLLNDDNFVYHLDITEGDIIHDMSYATLNLNPEERMDNFVEILTSFIGLSYDAVRQENAAEVFSDLSVMLLDGFEKHLKQAGFFAVDEFKYMSQAIHEATDYYLNYYYGIDTDMDGYNYNVIYERIQSNFDNRVQDFDFPDHKDETMREFFAFVDSTEWSRKLKKYSTILEAVGDGASLFKDGLALIGELESYNKTDEKLVELLRFIRAETDDFALRAACDKVLGKFAASYTQNIVAGVLELLAEDVLEEAFDDIKDVIYDKCGIYGTFAKLGIKAGAAVSEYWFNTSDTTKQMQTIYCLDRIGVLLAPLIRQELKELYTYDEVSAFRAAYAADALYHMRVLIQIRKFGEESYYKLKDSVYGSRMIEACKALNWWGLVEDQQVIEEWYTQFCSVIFSVEGSLYKMIPTEYFYQEEDPTLFQIEEETLVSYNGSSATVYLPASTLSVPYSTVASYAFEGNATVVSAHIPDTVGTISEHAFYNCSSLKSITINAVGAVIQANAFYGCSDELTIFGYAGSTAEAYATANNIPFVSLSNAYTTAQSYRDEDFVIENGTLLEYLGTGGNVYIPYGVTRIDDRVFDGNESIYAVIFPDTLTEISYNAFSGCTNLQSVTIPSSVTFMDFEAFGGCTGLKSVTFNDSAASIGKRAFADCSGLTTVDLGDCLTGVGDSAFRDCSKLTSVTIPGSVGGIGARAFMDCIEMESLTLGEGITEISYNAFSGCTNLQSVTIPSSVTFMDFEAFGGCTGLKSVTFNDSAASIGKRAFADCSGLTTVELGDCLTGIGESAFEECSKLTSIVIPGSVTSVGSYAFAGCVELVAITLPLSITSIEYGVFEDCSRLGHIWYAGGDTEKSAIVIDSGNEEFISATWHYHVDGPTYTPGDVNDDGKVNNKDLGLLLQYLNSWEVEVNLEACDVTGDDKVNNKDLGILLQYLNSWDVELK